MIERVVGHQITAHIENNNLNEVMRSAYRQHHSTETAWVRLHNDILTAIDNNMAVLLVCLDLSAPFDTVDHGILLQRLGHRLGITGKCFEWLSSYLKDWMTSNMLKLNGDNSDIMILNGPRRPKIELPPVTICDESVFKSDSPTLLGVEVDSTLALKNHVINTTKCCFYKLHNSFKIRRFLSEDAAKRMVHTLITSRLDYCNSILNGLPNTTLEFLVRVQKAAARLISNKTKFQHISPLMKDLHWLPIKKRIEYKILVLTFKCVHNLAPAYLTELLHNRTNYATRKLELIIRIFW
ncbi:uncharacterized protein [Montipora capricornis]|uniref:uncharacterized protein n=1 Tax=Montipora capricornis TaxID=246305 RepID=UPI0035F2137F